MEALAFIMIFLPVPLFMLIEFIVKTIKRRTAKYDASISEEDKE